MAKKIQRKAGFVKNTNPVNRQALQTLLDLPNTKMFVLEETLYTDNSVEYKISIQIPNSSKQ